MGLFLLPFNKKPARVLSDGEITENLFIYQNFIAILGFIEQVYFRVNQVTFGLYLFL